MRRAAYPADYSPSNATHPVATPVNQNQHDHKTKKRHSGAFLLIPSAYLFIPRYIIAVISSTLNVAGFIRGGNCCILITNLPTIGLAG